MNVSLTPELEKWVRTKVDTGLYGSSSEVVRDALRLLYHFDADKKQRLEELRAELHIGVEQLSSGKSQRLTDALANRIKKSGRKKLHA